MFSFGHNHFKMSFGHLSGDGKFAVGNESGRMIWAGDHIYMVIGNH